MKIRNCTVILTLLLTLPVFAEEVKIPLFEDNIPNLGRQANPQDNIILTPSQLPDIRIDFDKKIAPPIKKKEIQKPSAQPTTKPAKPITLGTAFSKEDSTKMSRQLNDEIQRYQESKVRKEFEKAEAEAKKNKKIEEEQSKETVQPQILEDLFGQMKDVRTFDISGIELGMTPDEVVEEAKDRGYEITKVEHKIPLHLTTFYKERCHPNGRVIDKQNCIIDQAKEDEVYYISSITMVRPQTAEYMQVLFSSHATDNEAYKIYYENKGDNSLNYTRKNLAKKVRRRDAFWNLMYETYGQPDDKDNMIWGNPQEAYMQAMMQGSAYNAYIVLEDKSITDEDYIAANEQSEELRYKHSFTFSESWEDEE